MSFNQWIIYRWCCLGEAGKNGTAYVWRFTYTWCDGRTLPGILSWGNYCMDTRIPALMLTNAVHDLYYAIWTMHRMVCSIVSTLYVRTEELPDKNHILEYKELPVKTVVCINFSTDLSLLCYKQCVSYKYLVSNAIFFRNFSECLCYLQPGTTGKWGNICIDYGSCSSYFRPVHHAVTPSRMMHHLRPVIWNPSINVMIHPPLSQALWTIMTMLFQS